MTQFKASHYKDGRIDIEAPPTEPQLAAMAWIRGNGGYAIIGKRKQVICRGMTSNRDEVTWGALIAKGYLTVEGARLVPTPKGAALECGVDIDTGTYEDVASERATRDLERVLTGEGKTARRR